MPKQLTEIQREFDTWVRSLAREEDTSPDWVIHADTKRVRGLAEYIREVLPLELTTMAHQVDEDARGGVLVAQVGFSPEPILILHGLLRPRKTMLLHSAQTAAVAAELQSRMRSATVLGLDSEWDCETKEIYSTDSEGIYRALRDHLTRWGLIRGGRSLPDLDTPLTIDITGGKKSMVSAAFLFASEFETKVVYVDAEGNDPRVRAARPGSMEVKTLDNPITALALRQFRAIRLRFEAHDYAAALVLLEALTTATSSSTHVYEELQVERLTLVARACVAWEDSDYQGALKGFRDARCEVPGVVEVLAALKPQDSGPARLAGALRNDARATVAYLEDAWRWVERRRAARSSRADFLRLFALGEFATECLYYHMIEAGCLTVRCKDSAEDGWLPFKESGLKAGDMARHHLNSMLRVWLLFKREMVADEPFDRDALVKERAVHSDRLPAGIQNASGSTRGETLRFSIDRKAKEVDGRRPTLSPVVAARLELPEGLSSPGLLGLWLHSYGVALRNQCAHRLAVVDGDEVDAYFSALRALIDFVREVLASMNRLSALELLPEGAFRSPTFDQLYG